MASTGPSMSPADAVQSALRAHMLANFTASVYGGDAPSRPLMLKSVRAGFPRGEDRLEMPCIALTNVSLAADDFDESIESDDDGNEEWGLDSNGDGHALARLEQSGLLQVDYWGATKPEREAMAAALHGFFRGAPEDPRRLLLELGEAALPPSFRGRAKVHARLMIDTPPDDIDDPLLAIQDEWRGTCRVRWEAHYAQTVRMDRIHQITLHGPGVVTPTDSED